MAREFRKGIDEIKKDAERKPGKRLWTPNNWWGAGDVKTIAFLTAADEAPKVRIHQLIRIPDDSRKSGERMETVICKKDPAMASDFGGQCPTCDYVGHEASEKYVALAVELEPIKDGKRVTGLQVATDKVENKEGETVEYPRWGLVIQASKNFFSYFAAYHETTGDIREVAWEIQREGGGSDTKYHPFVVMNGRNVVDLPDMTELLDKIPSLDELLEEMADPAKYAVVEALQPGSQPSFGGKKKAAAKDDGAAAPSGERASEFNKMREEFAVGVDSY